VFGGKRIKKPIRKFKKAKAFQSKKELSGGRVNALLKRPLEGGITTHKLNDTGQRKPINLGLKGQL